MLAHESRYVQIQDLLAIILHKRRYFGKQTETGLKKKWSMVFVVHLDLVRLRINWPYVKADHANDVGIDPPGFNLELMDGLCERRLYDIKDIADKFGIY